MKLPVLRVGAVKDVERFQDHLHSLGLEIPCDSTVIAGSDSPLRQPLSRAGIHLANRIAVHPMEGWDATADGNIFMTDVATLRWVRGQPWKEILTGVAGSEILSKILDSDVQSDNPASVSAFLATLEPADAAILSSALALRPIESARRSYWFGLVQQEIRLRKSRIEGSVRLNFDKPEAYAQAQAELNGVLELESRFASDFKNLEPAT